MPRRTESIYDVSPKHVDYYVKTQAAALLTKYKNQKKGIPIYLSEEEYANFEQLKQLFGESFDLNNVICVAGYFLDKYREHRTNVQFSSAHTKLLHVKPTEESIMAMLKHRGDETSFLAKLGIRILVERLLHL